MALNTETCTAEMEQRIEHAFGCHAEGIGRKRLGFDFEHGQWWVTDLDTGAQWSVCDAEGDDSVDGFDFERVTQGDEGG